MSARPLIMFPFPEETDREKKKPFYKRVHTPDVITQYERLTPTFNTLRTAFNQKKIRLQQSPIGINPDFALVFEIIGSVESFYTAVKYCDGIEWGFDQEFDGFCPDDDFYEVDRKTGERSNQQLTGKIYCIMSNQQAMDQMISLWRRHSSGEDDVFERGFAGIRDVFTKIRRIRKWDALDRVLETQVIDYWKESLTIDGNLAVPFEIELFYRKDQEKRENALRAISHEVEALGGSIQQECIIDSIAYHALLAVLPRNSIQKLVASYDDIELAQVDDIMFFRPTCQSAFPAEIATEVIPQQKVYPDPVDPPLIGILDGMPLQNHFLLQNRIVIDDPDDYAAYYESRHRVHGTAMSSLVIYGDLNRQKDPINSQVYLRPILKPKEVSPEQFEEIVPDDKLFVDVIHRAIIRIAEGEGANPPVAPTVKVINLSVGDPVRQLGTIMSPAARLLDYLSFKYNLLFIISAGNHPEALNSLTVDFSDIKNATYTRRNKYIFESIKSSQRHMKVLAPAESINSLTVGALYNDFCNTPENERHIYAVERGMPSPISSFGKGYRSMITPDLFYYGGRKFIRKNLNNEINWLQTNREPGCKVAAPYAAGGSSGQAFTFGTSAAAAQIAHESAKCYDTLSQVFKTETGENVPDNAKGMLLKAMLTHGATWERVCDKVASATGDTVKQLSKWIGNGIPNTDRVQECTKNRITLIGMGSLAKDEGHLFKLPLPMDFSASLIKRKLTVTLAYFSPISPDRQQYRVSQLWFDIIDEKKLVPDRQNTEWQAVRKGTLQHEIFTGEKPVVWNEDALIIRINCREEIGKLKVKTPYCIFVTFEVAEGMNIDLYSGVYNRIKQPVRIQS